MGMNSKRITEYAYLILAFCLPVFIWNEPNKTALYVYPKIIALCVLTLVLFGAKIYEILKKTEKKSVFRFSLLDAALLIFLAYQGISLFWSINFYLGIEYLSLLIPVGFFYVLFKNESFEKGFYFKLFAAISFSSLMVCAYGLCQLAGIDFINQPHKYKNIVVSTLGNKNFLSQYLVFSLWAHFYLLTYKTSRKFKTFFIAALFINLFVLLATLSKTGIVALGAMIFFLLTAFVFYYRGNISWKKTGLGFVAITVLAAIVYSLAALVPYNVEADKYYIAFGYSIKHKNIKFDERRNFQAAIHNQVLLVYYKMGELRSLDNEQVRIRYLLIKNSVDMIKENWLKGVGLNQWQIHYQKYQTQEEKRIVDHLSGEGGTALKAHNEWLQIFAELGIVGFLLFCAIFIVLFRTFFRNSKEQNSKRIKLRRAFLLVYILTFCVEALTSFVFHNIVPLWSFFLVLAVLDRGNGKEWSHKQVLLGGLILSLLGNVYLLRKNYRYGKRQYFHIIGSLYRFHGNIKNAEIGYRNALFYDKNDYQTYFHLGAVSVAIADQYRKQGEHKAFVHYSYAAKDFWEKTLRYHPYLSRAYYNVGNILYDLAEMSGENKDRYYKEAAENYEKAIGIFPEYTNAYVNLGNVYATLGIFILEMRSREEAVKFFGEDKGGYFFEKNEKEKGEMAEQAFELALNKHNKAYELYEGEYAYVADPTIYKSLGIDYYYLGDYESAKRFFRMYLKKNPKATDIKEIEKTIQEMEGDGE